MEGMEQAVHTNRMSMRQTYRMFLFEFLGISTLLLPAYLAGASGVYGGVCILAAGVMGILYLAYLIWCRKKLQTDLVTFLAGSGDGGQGTTKHHLGKRATALLLALLHTAAAGYTGAVTAGMVRQSLIKEESYALILLLVLLVAWYAAVGEETDRIRVYEILFWFVMAPLVVMLLVAAKEVDLLYYVPVKKVDWNTLAGSTYAVFGCFAVLSAVLFLPEPGGSGRGKEAACPLFRSVGSALVTAVLLLLAAYYVMVGTFGENALAVLPYPAITLMSMIQFTGGFLKRLDAIMLAVWFFMLFALLEQNLYFGSRLLSAAAGKGARRGSSFRALVGILLLTFASGLFIGCWEGVQQLFVRFFLWVQLPLYVVIPGVCAAMKGGKRRWTGGHHTAKPHKSGNIKES